MSTATTNPAALVNVRTDAFLFPWLTTTDLTAAESYAAKQVDALTLTRAEAEAWIAERQEASGGLYAFEIVPVH